MLNQLKLSPKLTLILLIIFVVGSSLGGFVLSSALQNRAEEKVTAEGVMLMESMNAVRRYTDQQVRPLLEADLSSEEFLAETIPAYSSRRVFELMQEENRNRGDFEYIYKEAVLNPTNPKDEADDFEQSLIAQFLVNGNGDEMAGFRRLEDRGLVFYSARPIVIKEQSCLRCHSTPEAAPQGMLAIYGRDNGFNWRLNEVLGTQVVYVPAEAVFNAAKSAFSSVMSVFFGVFAIALLCLNWLLKPTVIKPIQHLARLAQKLAADDIKSGNDLQGAESQQLTTVVKRKDELGQLGRIFQNMVSEVIAREERLRQQIRSLKIEIDERRKAKEVQEIVETDYFQDLQQKAKDIRKRNQTGEDA